MMASLMKIVLSRTAGSPNQFSELNHRVPGTDVSVGETFASFAASRLEAHVPRGKTSHGVAWECWGNAGRKGGTVE